MRSSVKWLCLVGLLIVLPALFPACTSSAPRTRFTDQQVAVLIAATAVPSIDYYLKQNGQQPLGCPLGATGNWTATYGEGALWTVKGQILVRCPSEDKICSSTWTLSDADGTMKLVELAYP